MKKIHFLTTLCLILGLVGFAQAQMTVEQTIKEWERAKAYTKEYLDAMPESKYDFKPTAEMRSFAQQMLHITDSNYGFGSAATGEKNPYGMGDFEKKTTDKSKANITKIVLAGYDFVIDGIKKMTPTQLNEVTKLFGRFEMTKAMVLAKDFEHQTHQRGQTTVYLRLAGATPPKEQLF
jgi:uncharacterized damage-inducible protein DinB